MAMGMAVISTRHAGIPLAIENEISGVLINERDTASLAQQLVRLYHNPELRVSLGRAARAGIEGRFTMRHMYENLFQIYCEAADRKEE
jgi:colanic acid/amylovoran biosynthesis glycosyltransferase